MWKTKAASVAKRMSTAMFVRNDIRSKYTGSPSKTSIIIYYYLHLINLMTLIYCIISIYLSIVYVPFHCFILL